MISGGMSGAAIRTYVDMFVNFSAWSDVWQIAVQYWSDAYANFSATCKIDSSNLKVKLCVTPITEIINHAFLVVNSVTYGFYPTEGDVFYSVGDLRVNSDFIQSATNCVPITPPCGKKLEFETCVQEKINKDLADRPPYSVFYRHCYAWASRITNSCYRESLIGF